MPVENVGQRQIYVYLEEAFEFGPYPLDRQHKFVVSVEVIDTMKGKSVLH